MSFCGGVKTTENQTLKRCSSIWFLRFLCGLWEAVCGAVFAKVDILEVVSKLLLQILENCHSTLQKSLGLALLLSLDFCGLHIVTALHGTSMVHILMPSLSIYQMNMWKETRNSFVILLVWIPMGQSVKLENLCHPFKL